MKKTPSQIMLAKRVKIVLTQQEAWYLEAMLNTRYSDFLSEDAANGTTTKTGNLCRKIIEQINA